VPTPLPATDSSRTAVAPTAAGRAPSQGSIVIQFVLTGIIWGSSFLFMKVALGGLLPRAGRLVAAHPGRSDAGAVRRAPARTLPRSLKLWAHMTVLAVSFCVVPFLLFSWAQQHVTSGLASIYNATTPIMTAVMAGLLFRVERLKLVQIAGIVVGILG
jgi:drug/metabolite transporter (DMT)-like permease